MQKFIQFLYAHPIPGAGLFIGPAISVGSLGMDIFHLAELGLSPSSWAIIGLLIFFGSTIGILYRWWEKYEQPVTPVTHSVSPSVRVEPGSRSRRALPPPRSFNRDTPLDKIWRAKMKNETINVDGKEFVNCTFENVTLYYAGDKPFRFTHSKFNGPPPKIITPNPLVYHVMVLARDTGGLKEPLSFEMTPL